MLVVDWGSVPAWLAIVCSGGGAAAVATARSARRTHGAAVYVTSAGYRVSDPPDPDDFTGYKLVNSGTLPVHDVGISVWEFGRRRWLWRFRNGARWMTGERLQGRVYPSVEPGDEKTANDMPAPHRVVKRPRGAVAPLLLLTFRDGVGRRWVKWPDGRLNRVHFARR
jgi:hypothetical protein